MYMSCDPIHNGAHLLSINGLVDVLQCEPFTSEIDRFV